MFLCMRYISFFLEYLQRLQYRLIHLSEKEPLNKLSIVVIIFLDIFVFSMIGIGMEQQYGVLWTTEQYVPNTCHAIVIDKSITTDTSQRIWAIDDEISFSSHDIHHYVNINGGLTKEKLQMREHPICREVYSRLSTLAQSPTFSKLLSDWNKSTKNEDRDTLKVAIVASPEYQAFWQYVTSDDHATTLQHDLNVAEWWYPVKKFGMDLLFLLPLCGVFWWWGIRSVRRGSTLQTFISSHLLVVASFLLLQSIVCEIYSLIPKELLDTIWRWLLRYNIIALWYYFLIVVGIVCTLSIIYLIQRKFSDPERIRTARLAASACYDCGKKLPGDCIACPFCSARQYRVCRYCRRDTYVAGQYCRDCGLEE